MRRERRIAGTGGAVDVGSDDLKRAEDSGWGVGAGDVVPGDPNCPGAEGVVLTGGGASFAGSSTCISGILPAVFAASRDVGGSARAKRGHVTS